MSHQNAKRPRVERRRAVSNESVPNKILLLEGVHRHAAEIFRKNGFVVEEEKKALSEDELLMRLEGVVALGVRSKTRVTAKVLAAGNSLLCTGNFCIGTDGVDLAAAAELGVAAFNAPFSNTRSVAELVMSHCVALARKVFDVSTAMHKGEWRKSATGCNEVRGKTIGIVGYGHVGSQVSVLSEALGMKVIFYDTSNKMPIGNATAASSLEELLVQVDFVTLHVPKSDQTNGLIGSKELSLMKAGAYLVNYARGTVVDIDALALHLRSGHLRGAAIDVFPSEPAANGENKFDSPLVGCPNTILTPHIGGSTQEAQALIGTEVAQKLVSYILRGDTSVSVNLPQLPPLPRILSTTIMVNIHKNVPGVVGNINKILSAVNVRGQQLRTTSRVGYIFVELDTDVGDEVMAAIGALDTSIQTRLLE